MGIYMYASLSKHDVYLGSGRAEEQLPKPDHPCKLCQGPSSPNEYARLGGFCSERHKWEWSVAILTLPHAMTECCILRLIRDSGQNQN